MDPRQWAIEDIYLGTTVQSLRVASWVSTLQPAVQNLHINGSCEDALPAALSVAPRTVSRAESYMCDIATMLVSRGTRGLINNLHAVFTL